MGLFVENGNITAPAFLILLGIPVIIVSDRWKLGILLIVAGFLSALSQSLNEMKEEDKHEIRYRYMSAADISDELEAMGNVMAEKDRAKCLAALAVLAMKWSQDRKQQEPSSYHPHELESICQDAAYIVFRLYPNDDEAVAAALSLNAVVAKDEQVRERHLHEADVFGLNVSIDAMRAALKRAQASQDRDEQMERLSAELQRKACLLLGALADGDSGIATKVVEEGGLEAILDALKWYRFHEEVASWGLWAIFVLCYDHAGNKKEMIRLGGIQVVCMIMKNNSNSLEVSRHGTAILFDLLREAQGDSIFNVAQIRKMALNAGLHDVMVNAMNEFETSMEIVMMGQEMLVATGYQGEIPRFQPVS